MIIFIINRNEIFITFKLRIGLGLNFSNSNINRGWWFFIMVGQHEE